MNKILILVGSNSKNSINREVAKQIKKQLSADLIELSQYNVDFYSDEKHSTGIPEKILELQNQIDKYEKIVLVTPEHNGYLPSFVKNIFDWLSVNKSHNEGKYFYKKLLYIISASPGSTGGETVRDLCSKLLNYSGATINGTYGVKNYNFEKNIESEIKEICSLISK